MRRICEVVKGVAGLPDSVERLMEEKMRYAFARLSQSVSFIEGFLPFFEKLKSYDIKIAVATNADDHELQLIMDPLRLRSLFGQHIYGISCVDLKAKPNPAIFLYAARMIGVDPEDCVVIEDSANGIKGAKNAGMLCIGINTSKKPELLQEADIIVNSFDEIDLEQLLNC